MVPQGRDLLPAAVTCESRLPGRWQRHQTNSMLLLLKLLLLVPLDVGSTRKAPCNIDWSTTGWRVFKLILPAATGAESIEKQSRRPASPLSGPKKFTLRQERPRYA